MLKALVSNKAETLGVQLTQLWNSSGLFLETAASVFLGAMALLFLTLAAFCEAGESWLERKPSRRLEAVR